MGDLNLNRFSAVRRAGFALSVNSESGGRIPHFPVSLLPDCSFSSWPPACSTYLYLLANRGGELKCQKGVILISTQV